MGFLSLEVVMEEIWKDVVGFEGVYQVSNLGRVRRVKKYVKLTTGGILKPEILRKGYLSVRLSCNGIPKRLMIARLVAQAFIPNPDNKPEVNHKNGIKAFNWPENLEWVTCSENNLHRCRVLGLGRGETHGMAKLTNKQIIEIKKMLRTGNYTYQKIGERFNALKETIYLINKRKIWKHIEI